MNDDATLVELAKSGDQAAFAELYERYFDRVYDFLARTVHDSAEAADLTQDAFLKAMNSLHTLTKGASFKSWLFTIARNTALNRLERASRTQPLEGKNDEGEEKSYDVIDSDRFGNPEEAAEAASMASVVWEAAAALDPKYRSVLLLNLREGLDSAEIADVMGVTKNHAYVLVNRMKAALESAVGAVALFRNGRRHCAELDAVINRMQIGELSPEGRRVIERHAGSCEVCSEQRRKLASPFAIFAGITLIKPAPGLKDGIFSTLQEAYAAASPNDGGLASGDDGRSGSDSNSDGGGSAAGSNDSKGNGNAPNDTSAPATAVKGAGEPPQHDGTTNVMEDEGGHGSKRRFAVAAAAAVVLLITAPIAAVSFFGGGEETAELAVIVESPSPTAAPAMATVSPSATATATRTPTQTASPTKEATETPASEQGTPVFSEQAASPDLEPGGGGDGTGGPEAPTQVPAQAGPTEPGVSAPPASTPDAGGAPSAGGRDVLPPGAAEEPTNTPEPCRYSMSATPSQLVFDGSSRTQTVVLTGSACGDLLAFTASGSATWIVVTPASGSIPPGGSASIVVAVDVGDRAADSGRVAIESAAGILNVLIDVEAATATPTPAGRGGSGNLQDPCGVNCTPTRTPTPTPRLGFAN